MSLLPAIEVTQGTTGEFAYDLTDFAQSNADQTFIPGEVFSFPEIKPQDGLKFLQAVVVPIPGQDDDDDQAEYMHVELALRITVEVNTAVHSIEEAGISQDLKDILKKWLTNGDSSMEIKNYDVHLFHDDSSDDDSSDSHSCFVYVTMLCEDCYRSWVGAIVESPFLDYVWNKHMDSLITEGVCYIDTKVPTSLRDWLRTGIDDVAKKTIVDYHPNSNDIVRDLVHPALYPYIKGVSQTISQFTPIVTNEKNDFWQRPYEDSDYQWLPTPFKVSENGECSILEYINNLDRGKFSQLYKHLERLFEIFLPYFEEVWSYAKAIELFHGEDWDETQEIPPLKKEPVSLKGRELQVITKIVEYKLQPGQSYEGVWHAEGMSHENIVMTGIYFLDRDSAIDGAALRFKRAFTVSERNHVFWRVPQIRPHLVDKAAGEGFVPLGKFPTHEGYLLVFPNCHFHKIAKMTNTLESNSARRRIVVFFVVNPERRIISTREVPPQQNVISLSDAKEYRLKLMAERKYDKQMLNVRDIELCEH